VLKGPQDVTFTDNGSDVVRQMWGGLGGQVLDLKGIHWVRVFRPWQVAAHAASARARPRLRSGLRRLSDTLDNASVAVAGRFLEPAASGDAAAALTPRAVLDALPTVARRMRLYPDYDETFLEWLFEELTRVEGRGKLVAHLVRDESGRTAGWYLYYLRPGWRSEVLQLAAVERDLGRVLDHLLSHAYAHGSAAVRGRLEPGHVEAVVDRRCLLWHRGGALIHTRDPELQSAIHSERALVTRLEGEWWGDTFI
jgi:hypothetical protein